MVLEEGDDQVDGSMRSTGTQLHPIRLFVMALVITTIEPLRRTMNSPYRVKLAPVLGTPQENTARRPLLAGKVKSALRATYCPRGTRKVWVWLVSTPPRPGSR